MADYQILIVCQHGDDKRRIARAQFDAEYQEWNLRDTPATQMLDGDDLVSDAATGVLNQPAEQVTEARLRHRLLCSRCGLTAVAQEQKLQRALDHFRESDQYRITLSELCAML